MEPTETQYQEETLLDKSNTKHTYHYSKYIDNPNVTKISETSMLKSFHDRKESGSEEFSSCVDKDEIDASRVYSINSLNKWKIIIEIEIL